jgi:exodeoxyribonuclease-3
VKIATFNCNSIRKRMEIVLAYLAANKPDVLCLQETKVVDADFPLEPLRAAGYHVAFRGMKAYNGVATLSLEQPSKLVYGLVEGPDSEDFRILQTVIRGIPIINTYVPQGFDITTPKYQYKLGWFKRLKAYFQEHLDFEKPAVWLGDLNIAPTPIDLNNPAGNAKHPCYHEEARNAYQDVLSLGWVDTFRAKYPDRVQYTFWDFFRDSFARDKGWRIDHILATPPLAAKCKDVVVDLTPRRAPSPSDHTVVVAEFDV